MKVTPDQLRAERRELTFTAAECAVIADALELADDDARALIECHTQHHRDGNGHGAHWYDTVLVPDEDRDAITLALRYLEGRGLLMRDTGNARIVSFHRSPQ